MSDIFLSYKHATGIEARQLASALSARGWTVWWDWNLPAGIDGQAVLDAQLDAAGCVVVLWSATSMQSQWVLYEARFAQRAGKLVQVLLEPVDVAPEFAASPVVNLIGWTYEATFHAGFDRLRAAIREPLQRRSLPDASRSGALARTPGAHGDALGRALPPVASVRARPAPVLLAPPPFSNLLDCVAERDAIHAALDQRANVAIAGEAGVGKTALLSYVGNLDHAARFHDGVIYLQAATLGEHDLAQALYDAFYDVPPGGRPGITDIRRHLADKHALLLIDDVEMSAEAVSALSACAPNCVWVFSSQAMLAGTQRRQVTLQGLPSDDGVALFERTLSRLLRGDERAVVAQIVEFVQGNPARIEQAAGTAALRGVATAFAELGVAPRIDNEDKRNRYVLAALACAGDVGLDVEQCASLALVDSVAVALADLVRRGLAQHTASGFRLAPGVAPKLETTAELTECRDRATAFFTRFAIESRETPRRVARFAAPMMASMAWAAEHGHSADALRLARAADASLIDSNRWDAWREMLSRAHAIAVAAGDGAASAWALHQQGTRAALIGDQREARRLLNRARIARRRSADSAGLQVTRQNLKLLGRSRWAMVLPVLGALGVAALVAIAAVTRALPEPLAQLMKNIPLARNLVLPDVAIDPLQGLAFGTQDIGASAARLPLRIDNRGLTAIDVIDVSAQGADARSFVVGNACDAMHIPRSSACGLVVQFVPDRAGKFESTIAVRVRDAAAAYMVAASGIGNATPVAQVSPPSIDFGETEIGAGANVRDVMLRNSGSAPLMVTGSEIDGDGEFRIVDDSCKDLPVAPGAQCVINLGFLPTDDNTKRASLVIHDNASGSPRAVAISGTGYAPPQVQATPGHIDFGQQDVGTQSAARPIRVHNGGNTTVDVGQVTFSGSNAFRVQGNCSKARLVGGATCDLAVRFVPATAETHSGKVVIPTSVGTPIAVEASGTAIAHPRFP